MTQDTAQTSSPSFSRLPSKYSSRLSDGRTTPRISRLLGTVLGSPFFIASDVDIVDGTFTAVPRTSVITRPSSPSPTLDFSIVSPPTPPMSPVDSPPDVFSVFTSENTPTCSLFPSPGRRVSDFGPILRSPSKLSRGFLPRLWDTLSSPSKKGKGKRVAYIDGEPLDGEEGELIDDEACFIDARAVTGIDMLSVLPDEISLYLLLFLDLPSIVSCLSVSRRWRALANDNLIWRELFHRRPGWNVDVAVATKRLARVNSGSRLGSALEEWGRRCMSSHTSINSPQRMSMISCSDSPRSSAIMAPLSLDWLSLYKTRLELDHRWLKAEPRTTRISGHEDSVYCLEFDSEKIITGSRDKTIKIWSLRTGKLKLTLRGHVGSVLCLKFDKTGFMVSGSSDCSIIVWDLHSGGEVKAVLRGHAGGVLDLKIDQDWIVSCSKDAMIRVWSRKTLQPFCSLRGHEGPVNAVGLQDGRVVSASGDGRMMLWDIASGSRIRTFEGHDRGLACIEFKDDFIVSGSNDCKIKVWSASTGECLRTLVGHDLLVRALSFDPPSGRLVSASYDKTVKIWDLHSGKMLREFKHSHVSHIFDVKFDACRIVSTSHDQKIVILDFAQDLDTGLFL